MKKNLTYIGRLRNDLLSSYDPYVRPVKNETDNTLVTMSFVSNYISLVSAMIIITKNRRKNFTNVVVYRTCTNLNLNLKEGLN